MNKRTLGNSLTVSAMGLGCMGLSEFYGPATPEKEALALLHRACELGIDFFDTADAYGPHLNETLIATFVKETSQPVKLATKFGIVRKPGEYARTINNTPDYIREACEASLARLGVEHIDLYYVHRINKEQPIEDTMQALSELVTQGKIGHIGLCEVSAETLRKAHAVHPVTAVQTEYSLWTRDVEQQVLPCCRELGIGFVPYSPLGRGYLTGTYNEKTTFEEGDFRASLPRFTQESIKANQSVVDMIEKVAKSKHCTSAQVALAWLMTKGEDIVPIPGTKRIAYLEQNTSALDVALSSTDIQLLDEHSSAMTVVGERYTEEGMKGLNA